MPRASSPSQVRGEHPSAAPLPRATAVRRMRALSHRSHKHHPEAAPEKQFSLSPPSLQDCSQSLGDLPNLIHSAL